MLESLKYVYKVTDVFKPNKIVFRMIEEVTIKYILLDSLLIISREFFTCSF